MATTSAPKSTGLKYTYRDGEGYREWYKANMGADWDGTYLNAKPEGMSDVDWTQGMMLQQFEGNKSAAAVQKAQTGQQLTDIYNQQTSAAQASFNSMANQYGQQMKGELEYAGVLHERMKRYLPQQMAAQGMGNMGVAQTAGANAVAKHVSNRGAIIGQHQASMNELSRNYGERQAALDTEYRRGMMAADAAYNDRVAQLDDQRYSDDMALFGQTVEEKAAEQEQYFLAGSSGIANATTREEALALAEQMKPYVSQAQYDRLVVEANNRGNVLEGIEEEELEAEYETNAGLLEGVINDQQTREDATAWLDTYINSGLIPESMRIQFESLIDSKFDKSDATATEAGYDKTVASMNDLIAQGKSADALAADLQSYIDSGSIRPEDAEHFKKVITGIKEAETKVAGDDMATEAKALILAETTAEGRKTTLEKYKGQISEEAYTSLSNLIDTLDRNDAASDKAAAYDKTVASMNDLIARGTTASKLEADLQSYIDSGSIRPEDAEHFKKVIESIKEAETKVASDDMATEAKALILAEKTAEGRKTTLENYKGLISEEAYTSLSNLVDTLDRNQSAEDTQAGYDQADTDLRTLYSAGASSADLQSTYDALAAAGKIEPGREQFWKSMISLRKKEETDLNDGKISAEQKENSDFALTILGEAIDPESRAEIMAGCATWLEQGMITQTQYDMAKAYCKVLDGNAEYLDRLEDESQAEQDHQISYENTLTYIAFAAVDYDDAWRYAVERRNEFSDTEWESIEIQLAARKKADDDANLANQSAEQAEAESRFVKQMSLYASSADATAKISALLESYKERLHPDVYDAWRMYIDDLADDPNQQLVEKQQEQANEQTQKELDAINKGYGSAAEYDAAVLAGQEPVEYEGMEYLLSDKQINVSESAYKEIIESNLKSSGYEGIFDKSIKNGTTVTFAGLNKEDVCLTYYNGAWYASKLYRGSGGRGGNF